VLLGDSDAAAAAQAAAADALGAAAVDASEHGGGRGLSLPPAMAVAAGSLVVGSSDGSNGSRGCPLYAKYYDKLYPHSAQAPRGGRPAQAV
jgi:hypothetical protein